MTHSNTGFFKSRSVFTALSQINGIQFHERDIQSNMTNSQQSEVISANFDLTFFLLIQASPI